MPSQNDIREELANQFGSDYIFLGNIKQSEAKVTTSPALNEEVGDNIFEGCMNLKKIYVPNGQFAKFVNILRKYKDKLVSIN
jgi:hypothetical protein